MNENKRLILNVDWCKGCEVCVEYCPKNVLEVKNEKCMIVNPDDCIFCELCEIRCPDTAIYIKTVGGNKNE